MAPLQNSANSANSANSDVKDLLERSLTDIHAREDLAERVVTRHARRRRRRRVATGVGAAVLAAAAAALTWVAVDPSPQAGPVTVVPARPSPSSGELIPDAQRRPAPALTGTTIEGKALRVDLQRGETPTQNGAITVVNFGGSWCAPCRAEQAAFVPIDNGPVPVIGGGVTFVGVDVRDSLAEVRSYVRQFRVEYPVIFDADQTLTKSWLAGIAGPPVTFVVDADGLIAARFQGPVTRDELMKVIDELHLEQYGGTFSHQEFIAGVRDVITDGRRLTIEWVNDRCGNTVQAVLAQVRVRENVRAVHVEVLGRLSPAAFDGRKPNALTGCLGVGINSRATVTLQAPLGKRPVLEDSTGKALAVLVR